MGVIRAIINFSGDAGDPYATDPLSLELSGFPEEYIERVEEELAPRYDELIELFGEEAFAFAQHCFGLHARYPYLPHYVPTYDEVVGLAIIDNEVKKYEAHRSYQARKQMESRPSVGSE